MKNRVYNIISPYQSFIQSASQSVNSRAREKATEITLKTHVVFNGVQEEEKHEEYVMAALVLWAFNGSL